MSDLAISDAAARAVAGLHDDAAAGIEGTASSVPGAVDGGLASAKLSEILKQLATHADDLAIANRGTAGVMRAVANDFFATEDAVAGQFRGLSANVEPEGKHP